MAKIAIHKNYILTGHVSKGSYSGGKHQAIVVSPILRGPDRHQVFS